ncbi:MAG: NAD(P)/FAD-dependent oxidoreductase [Acidimicrobiales bacterium]
MTLDVAVIGSGFGGFGAAVRLREQGVTNVAIFERADDLGGTWRDNRYPGCRCDVASALYSFSFAPNPRWTNTYSYQPEIWQYLNDVAERFRLRDLIRFSHDVRDISFDHDAEIWRITTSQGDYEARCVILATGGLAEPRLPDIEGLDTFEGRIMHTAKWDEGVSLENNRVGVIGTGASSIQVVPQIAALVEKLEVFQRTPSWILPHLGRPVLERTKRLFAALSLAERLVRAKVYWRNELMVLGFVKDPTRMSQAETLAREHLERQIADPELREQFTPHYRLGCKRVLISNDFYPAFNRDNVALVTAPILAVEPRGVRTSDGVLHEFDVLIAATGFYVTDNPMATKVHGVGGATLADAFCGTLASYKGTAFPGFPNFFMLGGPNTALGHSSIIFMHESQLNYATKAIEVALHSDALVEPKAHLAERWTRDLREKLPTTVWGTGCSSWYLNEEGANTTIWPDFTFKYRQATRRFDPRDHLISSRTRSATVTRG